MELITGMLDLAFQAITLFACGLGALIVLALLFGTRYDVKWDYYEADFLDERGREIGEFETKLRRRIDKKAAVPPDYEPQTTFRLRHPALGVGQLLTVRVADERVFEAMIEQPGRVRLGTQDALCEIKSPAAGQTVTVEIGGAELLRATLRPD